MNFYAKRAFGLAVAIGVMGSAFAQDVPWKVDGGSASISFATSKLRDAGFEIVSIVPTAFGNFPMENAVGFAIESHSNFTFDTERYFFGKHLGGTINIKGGFYVRYQGKNYPAMNLRVRANGSEQGAPMLVDAADRTMDHTPFALSSVATYFDATSRRLTLGWADLKFNTDFLAQIGRMDLADEPFGCFHIQATAVPTAATNPNPQGNGLPDAPLDVTLWRFHGTASLGRDGVAYPNGISGFAMITTSANLGTSNLPWYAPMDPRHPVIMQNMYRVRDGRLEQIGGAYLKHGFFATNTSDSFLPGGQNPGTGSLLGPNLTDTYGTGNNGDRRYLGPRSEFNPLTGVWTAFGSLFDIGLPGSGLTPDGQRSYTGNGVLPHQFRLEVRDSDLANQPTGTTFWGEGIYYSKDDSNLYNNVGTRRIVPTWNGSSWSISEPLEAPSRIAPPVASGTDNSASARFYQQLAIQRYIANIGGDASIAIAQPQNEGDVLVGVNPINLGNGTWRYEVVVFNYTSDRQIRRIEIPIMKGLTVTGIGYRDANLALGGWTGAYDSNAGLISWSTQTFTQNPNANSLKYGYAYNFWFTANLGPSSNEAVMNLFKPRPSGSTLDNLVGALRAPHSGFVAATTLTIDNGVLASGNVASLSGSDNNRVVINQNMAAEEIFLSSAIISGVSPVQNAGQMEITVESGSDIDNRYQTIQMFDWVAGQYVTVNEDFIGITDTTRTINLTSNVARFVQAGTRLMRMRVYMETGAADIETVAQHRIDVARWRVGL